MRFLMIYYLKDLKPPSPYEVGSNKHHLIVKGVAVDFELH